MANEEKLVEQLLTLLGGKDNVRSATNCMTRLRVRVTDGGKVDEEGIKNAEGVLGLVRDEPTYLEIVVGPGKSRKCADVCAAMGIPASAADAGVSTDNDWQANKAAIKAGQSEGKIKRALKTVGQIFIPLIPGVVAAGICSGLGTLLTQLYPDYASDVVWGTVWNLLALINSSLLTYITAWAGYRAAERFGGTPILGGMLGMITSLSGIDAIKGCECYTDRSGKLNIEVYQREPVLRIVNKEGKGWYSDANGYLFPVYGSHVPRIMAVTGDIPDSDEWMSGLVELNGFISSDPYWKNMIVQMDIERNGDIVLIPQDGRMKIIFGKLGNTKDKFYRIKRFYDSVLPVSEGKYSEISVKYRDQIVCKKTK